MYYGNLPTNIVDFRGFDSSIMFILRDGIPRPVGDSPQSLSRAMLVGTMLVGRLGVVLLFEFAQGLQSLLFFVLHQNICIYIYIYIYIYYCLNLKYKLFNVSSIICFLFLNLSYFLFRVPLLVGGLGVTPTGELAACVACFC